MSETPIKLFATHAERYPTEEVDIPQGLAKAVLAAVPVLGAPSLEILSLIVAPSVAGRRNEWFKEIAAALDELEKTVAGFKVENLVNDEAFVSAALQATRIAIGTHQQEKRELLRTALLNIAVGKGPREELQQAYLNAIDAFSPSHVKVLKFFWTGQSDLNRAGLSNPLQPYAIGTFGKAIGELHPELKGQDEFLQLIMTDLLNRGLSKVARPDAAFPQQPAVTNMGIEFLRFILEPPK